MQDVCVSFWPEGDNPDTSTSPDMIGKVTDICSTDPKDPTHCATPSDIKLDRAKVQVMYKVRSPGKDNPDLQSPVFPKGTFWHLTKCWTNGLPQPAYQDNWWGQPKLPNNFMWSVDATRQQWKNNQASYPSKGWDTYQDGLEIPTPEAIAAIKPPSDWVPGQEPKWAPIAGGKGWGTPERSNGPPPGLWPGKSTALAGGGGGGGSDGEAASNMTMSGGNSTTSSSNHQSGGSTSDTEASDNGSTTQTQDNDKESTSDTAAPSSSSGTTSQGSEFTDDKGVNGEVNQNQNSTSSQPQSDQSSNQPNDTKSDSSPKKSGATVVKSSKTKCKNKRHMRQHLRAKMA
ncbi:MAG: hypothetical protein Q9168_008324 [Polycauliona sp. 1 TL-2023]